MPFLISFLFTAVLSFIFFKVVEEVVYRQQSNGFIPCEKHSAVITYLENCELLSEYSMFICTDDNDINYISCIIKTFSSKWTVVGKYQTYIVPRWSPLHKKIEAKHKELMYGKKFKSL